MKLSFLLPLVFFLPPMFAAAPLRAEIITTGVETKTWFDRLEDRLIAEAKAGRPLVVQVHVALCDNKVIWCGSRKRGNGNDLSTNLYWATRESLRGWLNRKGSGWTQVAETHSGGEGVLLVAVWKREVQLNERWRQRGVVRAFPMYAVAQVWRGLEINKAIAGFLADLYGNEPRKLSLPDGTVIETGASAHVVAYLGHNHWMDPSGRFYQPVVADIPAATLPKGVVVLACKSAQYVGGLIPSPIRVPLVFARDFLFPGGHALDGAVQAMAKLDNLAGIRKAAAAAYASGQHKDIAAVLSVLTNPTDRRWIAGRAAE